MAISQTVENGQKELQRQRKRAGISAPLSTEWDSLEREMRQRFNLNEASAQADKPKTKILVRFAPLRNEGGKPTRPAAKPSPMVPVPTPDRIIESAALRQPTKKPTKRTKPIDRSIRSYPDLLNAFYAAELAPVGRLYMIMRTIDRGGRGQVQRGDLAHWVTKKRKLYGQRNLQIILRIGNGIAWDEDRHGRIYYRSPDKIMLTLGAGRLTGLPVMFPTKALLKGMQAYNAQVHASWHAGRRESNPITRTAIRKVTAVPESTQRVYDDVAGVERHKHIAIAGKKTKQNYQATALERGRCVFTFKDWVGRLGAKGKDYIAFRMPNSYETRLKQATKGRQKKINRSIDLVKNPAQGNGDDVNRLYYQSGGDAGKAYNQDPTYDHYWQHKGTLVRTARKKPKLAGVGLWSLLPGQVT